MNLRPPEKLNQIEFVALMASLTSVIAFAIDGILPGISELAADLKASGPGQTQYIVSVLFLGFGFGQLLFGPISDQFGRRLPIFLGLGLYLIGALISWASQSFWVMLIGRLFQGLGGAGPRIVSIALIRDRFSGDVMAKISSLVMTVFILIPAVAPSVGQFIMKSFGGWRSFFIALVVFSGLILIWFFLRQKETLEKGKRQKISFKQMLFGIKEAFIYRQSRIGFIISGLIMGVLIGYLGGIQEIFTVIYDVGDQFPLYFAACALSVGGASFFNSQLVLRMGSIRLVRRALFVMVFTSLTLFAYLGFTGQTNPPLYGFMAFMIPTFFAVGFLFGNLNAIAMEPLGHIAGLGSAILGFLQSFIGVLFGSSLGYFLHGTIVPLAVGFLTVAVVGLFMLNKPIASN
ncbi:MAG: Bcr/CflA family drug resistance efflux transporter [Bdellovibrionaceae bacterium]|nr:Bcr/CflA family drug resistance efflux transporter [Pseudobdellovibrionaceae bacterium]|tara:strand:- start:8990 stop:10198 length:1209 start_codon:yes stop_codon:yes gene_type:complete